MNAAAILRAAAAIAPEALRALIDWLDGADGDDPDALAELPEVLKSELALERMKARAANP
jgi:hypothetical protein